MPTNTSGARGVRNNNPGNIDYNVRNDWEGQIGIEEKRGAAVPRFAVFDSAESGIRALTKLLINYRGKDGMPGVGGKGIDTIHETISRWAPGSENDTAAYIAVVSKSAGIGPKETFDIKNVKVMTGIVSAIIIHENGGMPYTAAVVAEGVRRGMA